MKNKNTHNTKAITKPRFLSCSTSSCRVTEGREMAKAKAAEALEPKSLSILAEPSHALAF